MKRLFNRYILHECIETKDGNNLLIIGHNDKYLLYYINIIKCLTMINKNNYFV